MEGHGEGVGREHDCKEREKVKGLAISQKMICSQGVCLTSGKGMKTSVVQKKGPYVEALEAAHVHDVVAAFGHDAHDLHRFLFRAADTTTAC